MDWIIFGESWESRHILSRWSSINMWINRPLEEPTVPFSDASNLHPRCRGIRYFDSMVNAQCDKGVILAKSAWAMTVSRRKSTKRKKRIGTNDVF